MEPRRLIFAVLAMLAILAGLFPARPGLATDLTVRNAPARLYFSPGSDTLLAVVKEIDNAVMEILVQGDALTSPRITKALAAAAKRAVSVEVMLDKSAGTDKQLLAFLAASRIPVLFDTAHRPASGKVMIIDKATIITGSFDFGAGKDKRPESLMIVKSPDLAGPYMDNWQKHKAHSGRSPSPGGKRP